MSRLRLLKVIVQPIFAVDDGKTLTEAPAEPVEVKAEDWPTYPTTQFVEAFNMLQAQVDTGPKVAPNRAARHARMPRA
jgi:hypothetical protein